VRQLLPSQAPAYFTPEEISRRHVCGAVAQFIVLLMVQIWLLTSTLESFLAGHRETAGPSRADLRAAVSRLWEYTGWSTDWTAKHVNSSIQVKRSPPGSGTVE
jgi:hypothetical protein